MATFGLIRSVRSSAALLCIHLIDLCLGVNTAMLAERPDNVIDLAPYRMAKVVRRQPPRPYLMWHPQVGFVQWPAAAPAQRRAQHEPRAVQPL